MTASVYATPPPDLSGEDTALSDVSNSSQISSSSSQSKATKRSITTTLLGNQTRRSIYESMQSDQSKKRRKQSTPIRLSALNLSADLSVNNADEYRNENKFTKKFPHSIETLETNELNSNISSNFRELPKINSSSRSQQNDDDDDNDDNNDDDDENDEIEVNKNSGFSVVKTKECEHCNEKFDSDINLGMHLLQNHSTQKFHQLDNDELKPDVVDPMITKIKIEPDGSDCGINDNRSTVNSIPRPEDWLSMPGLSFPFPPEAAAAALSASSYLSQLPLLSVPPVGPFPTVEGLSRPPLRIFNPEAYCDLCNKEFCNKYFLKTHKANKHGIYDPTSSASESQTTNQVNQLTQVLQMQFQQQQQQQHLEQQHPQQQQQQQPPPQLQQPHLIPQSQPQQQIPNQSQQQSPQNLIPPEPAIFCDVCHKRFTNVFAMKRHRNKAHEIPPPGSPPIQFKNDTDLGNLNDKEVSTTMLRLPEGFREDFSVEQEDVSFTPQPRKLSPSSSQQARDANFSVEKLKRLGVINPEAFCDLCCKEYCNKYFLRTHKLKRHGILVPADDIKDEKMQWPFVQTTPLNLMIVSEKLQQQKSQELGDSRHQLKQETENHITSMKINGTEHDDDHKSDNGKNIETQDIPSVNNLEGCNTAQDPEAISIDLQKLQSMILQLNDLSGQRPVNCNICGKEMENQYVLHAHVATEHSGDNNNSGMKTSRCSTPATSVGGGGGAPIETCKQCEKEFKNVIELKQHIIDTHGLSLNSPVREGFVTPDRPITSNSNPPTTPNLNDRRPPYTITPTSSYCEICNKELCNKYFMKTHMQRMHGIEIENGAQIGGVVCNICNKELCSKYFLRVHKHNTHGIVDEGSPLPQSRQNGEPPENDSIFSLEGSKPDMSDVGSRYFTHYTEVCPLCSRRFRSPKWLRAHLMSDHGKAGTDKLREIEQHMNFNKPSSPTLKIPNGGLALSNINPTLLTKGTFSSLFMNEDVVGNTSRYKEYQCSMCSFSTPYYAFLFIHERSHTFLSNPSNAIKSETAVSIAKDQQRIAQPSTTAASSSGTPTTTPASTPIPQTPQENANSSKREIQGNFLCELANLTNRPASYALPQQNYDSEIMQSFLIEESSNDNDTKVNKFAPAVVFLPVRERITGPITVSFTLTPA